MVFRARCTTGVKAGRVVYENQIIDITSVRFEDSEFNLDIQDGDKFIWLFRDKWAFGLYFDFTGTLETEDLWDKLGHCYKMVKYHTIYSFLSRGGGIRPAAGPWLVSVRAATWAGVRSTAS